MPAGPETVSNVATREDANERKRAAKLVAIPIHLAIFCQIDCFGVMLTSTLFLIDTCVAVPVVPRNALWPFSFHMKMGDGCKETFPVSQGNILHCQQLPSVASASLGNQCWHQSTGAMT